MKVCLSLALLLYVALGDTIQSVPVVDVTNLMRAPWYGARSQWGFYTSGTGPTSYTALTARYGFRLVVGAGSEFAPTTAQRSSMGWSADYVAPESMFFRLCTQTPAWEDDDYQLTLLFYFAGSNPSTGCGSTCVSNSQTNEAELFDDFVNLLDDIPNSPISRVSLTTASGCNPVGFTFNMKALKAVARGSIYLRLLPKQIGAGGFFDVRFVKGNNDLWNGIACTLPSWSSSLYSPCQTSFHNMIGCSDGVFQPEAEECDLVISSKWCRADCLCSLPYAPDGTGKCTACGNGALEVPEGEICDYGLDENCAHDCKACATGFALNSMGACTLCGNSIAEPAEECDSALSRFCMKDVCTCMPNYVSDGKGGCTMCGNGKMDHGEYCDGPNCSHDCSSCATGYVSRPRVGSSSRMCTMCGNGKIDLGEVCDSTDFNCNDDCASCSDFHVAGPMGCTRCGNGLLDAGEMCDKVHPGCDSDCTRCLPGMVASQTALGECTSCGNGVTDIDEACDVGVDSQCASDCNSCLFPYASVGRRCVTCGNGRLDEKEVCDRTQPGCAPDCQSCDDGYEASGDAAGTCVAQCAACCASLETDGEVDASVALGASLAFLLGVLGVTLNF